jgi:hypothetical protein
VKVNRLLVVTHHIAKSLSPAIAATNRDAAGTDFNTDRAAEFSHGYFDELERQRHSSVNRAESNCNQWTLFID